MALSFATVGGKVTAALYNALVNFVQPLGFSLAVPTSVTVGSGTFTLSTLGKVTISGASSVSINGCFTAAYDNYLIILDVAHSATAGLTFKMRSGGTDTTALSYGQILQHSSGSTVSVASSSGNAQFNFQGFGGLQSVGELKCYQPALTAITYFNNEAIAAITATTFGIAKYMGSYNATTAFDGITFTASAGTMTGTIRICGYNNG